MQAVVDERLLAMQCVLPATPSDYAVLLLSILLLLRIVTLSVNALQVG